MASSGENAQEKRSSRTKYSREQLQRLEEVFRSHPFIDSMQTFQLSSELGISTRQTRTWFQNKRAMTRRRDIKAAGSSYVPRLQCQPAYHRMLPVPTSARDQSSRPNPPFSAANFTDNAERQPVYLWRQPAPTSARAQSSRQGPPASAAYSTGDADGHSSSSSSSSNSLVRARSSSTWGGTVGQAPLPLGHLAPSGPSSSPWKDFLAPPQQLWRDGRLTSSTYRSPAASTPSPVPSSSEEDLSMSSSLELKSRRVEAVAPPRQFGSYDSLLPGLHGAPPSVSSTTSSHSAPSVWLADQSDGARSDGRIQRQPVSYDVARGARAAGPWQEQFQWLQGPLQQPNVGQVQQYHETVPPNGPQVLPSRSCQTNGASAALPAADEEEIVPGIESLTWLVLEMEAAGLGGHRGGAGNM